jgi:hypothetical protein
LGDYEQATHFEIPTFKYHSLASKELVGLHPEAKIWIFSNDIEKAKKFLDNFIPKGVRWLIGGNSGASTSIDGSPANPGSECFWRHRRRASRWR